MGNRDVFDGDASVFTEVPKMVPSECSSKVGDNAILETDCLLCSGRDKRPIFDPLGELVNGDVHVPEAT